MVSFPYIFEIYRAKTENYKDIPTKSPVIVKGLNVLLSEIDKTAIDTVNEFNITETLSTFDLKDQHLSAS